MIVFDSWIGLLLSAQSSLDGIDSFFGPLEKHLRPKSRQAKQEPNGAVLVGWGTNPLRPPSFVDPGANAEA